MTNSPSGATAPVVDERSRNLSWDPQVGHPHRQRILAVACLALVMVVVAVSSLNVAIPTIVTDLKPSSTELLWIVDAYALVFAGLLLLAGAIGDRYGRKKALVAGLIVFGTASFFASFAETPTLLIAARAVMGLGAAFVMPSTLSIITSVFPPMERPKAIATWAGFAGAGGALGPLLSGLVLKWGDWEEVFLINVPLVLITLAAVLVIVPVSRDTHARRLDPVGALLSVVTLGALLLGIIEGPDKGWGSAFVLIAFAVAVLAAVGFIAWELRTKVPMLDPRYFKIPGFSAGSGVIVALFFGMFGMFFLVAQYLQFVKGYTALTSGVATLPSAAMMIIIAPRSAGLAEKFGSRRVVVSGALFAAAGFGVMSRFTPDTPYIWVALALVLIGSGMAQAMAPSSTSIVTSLPLDKAGVASAVNDTTREVGGALGIAILGTILTSQFSSSMSAALPATVPDQVREVATEGIGPALGVAQQAPAEFSAQLVDAAHHAFTDGFHVAFLVSTALMLLVAVGAGIFMPRQLDMSAGH